MQHILFKKRHAFASDSLPRQAFVRPSTFKIIVVLLFVSGCFLVGTGIVALLLAPFLFLSGGFLLLFTLALLCVIGIGKGCVSFTRFLVERLGRTRTFTYLAPAIRQLQVLLALRLMHWLKRWLERHEEGAYHSGTASAHPHSTRVSPLLKGA